MEKNEEFNMACRAHDHIFARGELVGTVFPQTTVDRHCRPGGPWQRPLPGVVATHNGPLTDLQRQRAALVYAGQGSMLTGWAALGLYQIRAAVRTVRVDVLVAHERRRRTCGFARLHRSRRLPVPTRVRGLPVVPPARAAADLLADPPGERQLRALLHELVQTGRCSVDELQKELQPRMKAPGVAATLNELTGGARSVAEGRAQQLIARSGLPWPLWNPALYLDEVHLATPDAYWPEQGVLLEIDSRAHHLAVLDWEQTMARHNRLEATGLRILHVSPHQLEHEAPALIDALRQALDTGPHGPLDRIEIRPV